CDYIITCYVDHLAAQLNEHLEHLNHFSAIFIDNEKLGACSVSEKYTHSFTTFTGKELANKTGDSFHIVGGCGMSMPAIQSKPIPHAAEFVENISRAFITEDQDKAE